MTDTPANETTPTPDEDELTVDDLKVLLTDTLIQARDLVGRIADAGGVPPDSAPSPLADFSEFEKDPSKIPDLHTAEGSETVKKARLAIRAAGREIGFLGWVEATVQELAAGMGLTL